MDAFVITRSDKESNKAPLILCISIYYLPRKPLYCMKDYYTEVILAFDLFDTRRPFSPKSAKHHRVINNINMKSTATRKPPMKKKVNPVDVETSHKISKVRRPGRKLIASQQKLLTKTPRARKYKSARKDTDAKPEIFYGTYQLDEHRHVGRYAHIRSTPNMGRGVFAKRDIPAKTAIYCEEALLSLRIDIADSEDALHRQLREAITKLPNVTQRKFTSLTYGDGDNSEETRWDKNRFTLEVKNGTQLDAAFHLISMLNHSCRPNCEVRMIRGDPLTCTLYARKSVSRGEQLTIDYIPRIDEARKYSKTNAKRQNRLRMTWGFECQCPGCTDKKADADYAQLLQLKKLLNLQNRRKFDPADRDSRNLVQKSLLKYVKLLEKFHFFWVAAELAKQAEKFFLKADDYVSRRRAAGWAAKAAEHDL